MRTRTSIVSAAIAWLRIVLCVVLAAGAMSAQAQNTTAAVGGRVTDAEGKAVAGAAVSVLHVQSNSVINVVTDADGRYIARNLRVGGPYTVTITKDAASEKREGVFLALADTTAVDVRLGETRRETI